MYPQPLPRRFPNPRAQALGAVFLAPLPHGLAGAWDELVLMSVTFALFGGYVLWLRGVFGNRGDHRPPSDEPDDEAERDHRDVKR